MANITTTFKDNLRTNAITYSGTQMTDVAFGSGTANPLESDTTLSGEFTRVTRQELFTTSSKVTISGFLGSSSGNANNIARIGTFNSGTAGDMATQFKLTTNIDKTSDKEVWVDQSIEYTVTENGD